ncbi:uncharacterized protein BcabD6B2_28730 [Babesia caballi]|uniref:BRCT domain-containing protein n=1 Tax=Babesia caballi TaxID=5871 RepID=A0AAV4LUK9_BABCB|nr:hypothetical protein, conserved [Babesia caballi]
MSIFAVATTAAAAALAAAVAVDVDVKVTVAAAATAVAAAALAAAVAVTTVTEAVAVAVTVTATATMAATAVAAVVTVDGLEKPLQHRLACKPGTYPLQNVLSALVLLGLLTRLEVVDVDLEEDQVGALLAELLNVRLGLLAGLTPGGAEFGNDPLAGLESRAVVLGAGGDPDNGPPLLQQRRTPGAAESAAGEHNHFAGEGAHGLEVDPAGEDVGEGHAVDARQKRLVPTGLRLQLAALLHQRVVPRLGVDEGLGDVVARLAGGHEPLHVRLEQQHAPQRVAAGARLEPLGAVGNHHVGEGHVAREPLVLHARGHEHDHRGEVLRVDEVLRVLHHLGRDDVGQVAIHVRVLGVVLHGEPLVVEVRVGAGLEHDVVAQLLDQLRQRLQVLRHRGVPGEPPVVPLEAGDVRLQRHLPALEVDGEGAAVDAARQRLGLLEHRLDDGVLLFQLVGADEQVVEGGESEVVRDVEQAEFLAQLVLDELLAHEDVLLLAALRRGGEARDEHALRHGVGRLRVGGCASGRREVGGRSLGVSELRSLPRGCLVTAGCDSCSAAPLVEFPPRCVLLCQFPGRECGVSSDRAPERGSPSAGHTLRYGRLVGSHWPCRASLCCAIFTGVLVVCGLGGALVLREGILEGLLLKYSRVFGVVHGSYRSTAPSALSCINPAACRGGICVKSNGAVEIPNATCDSGRRGYWEFARFGVCLQELWLVCPREAPADGMLAGGTFAAGRRLAELSDELAAVSRQCRHIAYIQANFLAHVLKLEQPDVVQASSHRCFVPGCQGGDVTDLKLFLSMGDPPINTYHPINYIGIGLYRDDSVDTAGWYTAYVPLHLQCFGNDLYNLRRSMIQLIGSGKLWLPASRPGAGPAAGDPPNQDHKASDEVEESAGTHGDPEGGCNSYNVFRLPVPPVGVDDPDRYIFTTPSCMYATLPEAASVLNFSGLPVGLRVVIEVKVKPGSYKAASASLPNMTPTFDCCFPNDGRLCARSAECCSAIEWYVENVDDVVPQRLLFRILKKEKEPVQRSATDSPLKPPAKQAEPEDNVVDLITVMPPSSLGFVWEPAFQELRGLASDKADFGSALTFFNADLSPDHTPSARPENRGKPTRGMEGSARSGGQFLSLKIPWTENSNRVVFYLKSLIGPKWLEWDPERKVWRVHCVYLYECAKFVVFLGLRICDRVLFQLWAWLRSIGMHGVGEVFSKVHLVDWLQTNKVWSFQRISLRVVPGFNPVVHRDMGRGATPAVQAMARETAETVEIHMAPFNKEVVARFKERNAGGAAYVWQKERNTWVTSRLKPALEDLLKVLPHLREASQQDTFLSSRGINLRDINREQKKRSAPGNVRMAPKRAREGKDDEGDESEFATVSKMMITAAGLEPHLMRVRDKLRQVVEKVAPPTSSISASGRVVSGGAGTGGIELVEAPRGHEAWSKMSFCVVPNDHEGAIPVDPYDPQILASLIGEVFIVKESAIDYLLANFKRWPGPHDTVSYTRWNQIMTRNEARCWGDLNLDSRQNLAQTGLFCDEEFFISGSGEVGDAALCRLLVQLGNGKIVSSARDAEYVVITDRDSEEARELHRQFGSNDEDVIANTHGARHSTLVTPKFIYDCILAWRLQRPTRSHGHMAF